MTSSDAIPPDETAEPRDGRVIRLGSQVLPGTNGSQPLVVEFETGVATGKASEALAREQAAAIREVLAWIARNRDPQRRPESRRYLTRSRPLSPEATSHHHAPRPNPRQRWFAWSPAGGTYLCLDLRIYRFWLLWPGCCGRASRRCASSLAAYKSA
jgi:hypothetical protein